MADLDALIDDLADEQASLDVLVADLAALDWSLASPAEGWSVRHQIAHLAYFDGAAVKAIEAPEEFAVLRAEADTDPQGYGERVLVPYLELPGSGLLEEWRAGRDRITKALRSAEKGARVSWYGPSMSLASMVTARLMETWAHGQDVADALGAVREPSRRLEHVARLACLARPYSYLVRGRSVPDAGVRVELTGPDEMTWTFGDAAATDIVTGPLTDFCLVLTRRRHVADSRLTARGPVAEEWLAIGQAYAGPPGSGRSPGQFPAS
jgi:uncharacterized protein (TIGR03084 family)